ncbi:hypothetical protein KPH14_007565 [Odynerus spinipes]|uniref:Uncharacterized protein n=1 Tax=Odynerus spinipes TaxID=1348599 RepID=A0AAD9RHJ2_9HYME|nr:hypothetical protein KPH14_007565 [Odynerus spinipes]
MNLPAERMLLLLAGKKSFRKHGYSCPDRRETEESKPNKNTETKIKATEWIAENTRFPKWIVPSNLDSGQGCASESATAPIPSYLNRLRIFQEFAMQNKRFLSDAERSGLGGENYDNCSLLVFLLPRRRSLTTLRHRLNRRLYSLPCC